MNSLVRQAVIAAAILVTGAVVAGIPAVALLAGGPPEVLCVERGGEVFCGLDRDGDGNLSWDEVSEEVQCD